MLFRIYSNKKPVRSVSFEKSPLDQFHLKNHPLDTDEYDQSKLLDVQPFQSLET